jgi:hypothetical protein
MKYLITEKQSDRLNDETLSLYKKQFFKYWKRFGPSLDNNIIKLITGSENYRLFHIVRKWFHEFVGEENAVNIGIEILDNLPTKIDDCGTFSFEFEINDIEVTGNDYFTIYCRINENGSFIDPDTGRKISFSEVIHDSDDTESSENFIIDVDAFISELIEKQKFYSRTGCDFNVVISGSMK